MGSQLLYIVGFGMMNEKWCYTVVVNVLGYKISILK